MKSIVPLRSLFKPTLKVVKKEDTPTQQTQTPYLKAILSTTPTPLNGEKKVNLTTPDLNAALRYIKESAMLRR